jgi:hypothetical protein
MLSCGTHSCYHKECKVHVQGLCEVSSISTDLVLICSFNIWAYTAAGKALDKKVNGSQRRHKSRDPSRSNTAQTSSTGGQSPIEPKLKPFTQADMTASPAMSRRQSYSDTTPGQASTAASSVGSQVDLTQPIINQSAAHMANEEDIDDDDVQSEAGGSSESESSVTEDEGAPGDQTTPALQIVTVVGREPTFSQSHIVAERVSTHGKIRPFEPIDQVPALNPALREKIGQVHGEGAIHKWLGKRAEWDKKYSSQHQKWREIKVADRKQAEQAGFLTRQLHGERPPLCSLAGWYNVEKARAAGKSVDEISGKTSNMMVMWQRISQKVSLFILLLTSSHVYMQRLMDSPIGIRRVVRLSRRSRRVWRRV